MSAALSDWDLDLRYGLDAEGSVRRVLTIETVEVKSDRRWKITGNIYIETSCYHVNKGEFERSGIATSKATHWAFVLEDLTLIVTTEDLINTLNAYGVKTACQIEPNPSKGYLITVESLLKWQVKKATTEAGQ